MTRLVGYAVRFGVARKVAGVPALEVIAPTIRLTTAEAQPLELRWAHADVIATTRDRSLDVAIDDTGVRVAFALPAGPEGNRLREAVASGRLGGSCGWAHTDGSLYRWDTSTTPWTRTVVSAVLLEVSLTATPAYDATWAVVLDGDLELKWRYMEQRLRTWGRQPILLPKADVVITGPRRPLGAIVDALWVKIHGIEHSIREEYELVQRALTEHPGAVIVDVRYPRFVRSCEEVMKRRIPTRPGTTAAARRPLLPTPAPARGAKPLALNSGSGGAPTKQESQTMPDETELETRPGQGALVPASVRETFRRLKAFDDALEARIPGAGKLISHYRPYVDKRGAWHAGPVLRAAVPPTDSKAPTASRLSVACAERKMHQQRQHMIGEIVAVDKPALEMAAAQRRNDGRRRLRAMEARQREIALDIATTALDDSPVNRRLDAMAARARRWSREENQ